MAAASDLLADEVEPDVIEQPPPGDGNRLMEPLEEVVYLDQVRVLAIDHPQDLEVYPNEYFASNPPYPKFKVVTSKMPRVPAGVWDEHRHPWLATERAGARVTRTAVWRWPFAPGADYAVFGLVTRRAA